MVFSSLTFIYLFFSLVFLLYFAVRSRTWRNAVLLAAFLLFYAWGEPKLVVLMLAATLEAYLGGLVWLPLGAVCCLPLLRRPRGRDSAAWSAVSYILCAALALVCLIFLVSNSYNPFIYFRF